MSRVRHTMTQVGPIVVPSETDLFLEAFSLAGIPKVIEGFVYEIFDESTLPEINKCVVTSKPLLRYAKTIIGDLEHLRIIDMLENLELFIYHWQLDLMPCTQMGDDIAAMK